jgi:hypothetical protein
MELRKPLHLEVSRSSFLMVNKKSIANLKPEIHVQGQCDYRLMFRYNNMDIQSFLR